jgi:excisionase family DNA binding protein
LSPRVDIPRLSYSLREAAEALSLGVSTLQRAISHGLVNFNMMGRVVRIPTAEVERIGREGLGPIPSGYKRRTSGKLPSRPHQKKNSRGNQPTADGEGAGH